MFSIFTAQKEHPQKVIESFQDRIIFRIKNKSRYPAFKGQRGSAVESLASFVIAEY